MLQQDANHLHGEYCFELRVTHQVNQLRIIFDASLSRAQGALHVGIDSQPVRTIDGEKQGVCQEPLLHPTLMGKEITWGEVVSYFILLQVEDILYGILLAV